MDIEFPLRTEAHQLEEVSRRFFQQCLPKNWTSEKPENDYGLDCRVDLFDEEKATGLELLVQLKSSEKATLEDTETVRLSTSTYNYLWNKLQVAMLVKYVEFENEAYWLLFKDIPAPSQEHKTFTVHIPKTNRLSQINWVEVRKYIHGVTDKKLAAIRRTQVLQNSSSI